jgi:hypothetical protein
MAGFNDHADALGLDYFLDGFGDLGGEALLNLKAPGESSMRRGILLRPRTRPLGI